MDRLSIAALALTLAAACKSEGTEGKRPPPTAKSAGPRSELKLFTPAEITTLEGELEKRLDANARRSCPVPVLRGPERPGPAADDVVAFMEPTGPLASCFTKLVETAKAAKLEDLVDKRDPALVAIDKDCGELVATAVGSIAAHVDACSPYQPGRRVEAVDPLRPIQAAHLLGLHAEIVADKDAAAAVWLLATAARAMQDLSRGHVNLITSLTVAGAYEVLFSHVENILARGTLAPDAAAELAAAFEVLLANEPHFHDTLQGEQDWKGLYGGLMRVMPATWTPPGGVQTPDPRKNGMAPLASGTRLDERDSGGLVLASASEAAQTLAQACPPASTYVACRTGLELRAAKRATNVRDIQAVVDPDAAANKVGADKVKQLALDTVEPGLHPDYVNLLDKKVKVVWRLAAAQIALASLAAKCKPVEPPNSALDLLGEPMTVALDAGVLKITPPGFARPPGAQWKTKCP